MFLVLLTEFGLGPLDLESDALPIEPPVTPDTHQVSESAISLAVATIRRKQTGEDSRQVEVRV